METHVSKQEYFTKSLFSLPLHVLVIMRLSAPENCQQPLSSEAEMNLFSKARKLNLLLWLSSLHHLLPLSLPEKNMFELHRKYLDSLIKIYYNLLGLVLWVPEHMCPIIVPLIKKHNKKCYRMRLINKVLGT